MPIVDPNEVLGCSNKKLRFWITYNSLIVRVTSLEFIVYDVSTPANQANPVQVYPGMGRATVNIGSSCPTGDYVDADGGYVAAFTMPSTGVTGLFQIRWFYKRTTASTEEIYKQEFWGT